MFCFMSRIDHFDFTKDIEKEKAIQISVSNLPLFTQNYMIYKTTAGKSLHSVQVLGNKRYRRSAIL